MQTKSFLLSLMITWCSLSFAQDKNQVKGDQKYSKFYYQEAIEAYEKSDSLQASSARKLAEAYRFTNQLKKSIAVYKNIVNSNEKTAEDLFTYAQLHKMIGEYDTSDQWMKALYALDSSDTRAKELLKFPNYAEILMQNTRGAEIIEQNINSEAEDFGPTYLGNQIVFASSRKQDQIIVRKWSGNKLPFVNMFTADSAENMNLKNVAPLETDFNAKFHDGPASFSADGKMMVFTRNDYDHKSSEGTRKLQLFYAFKNKEGYSDPKAFPFNNKEYSYGHAAVSADGKRVYFASDMPGGIGGTDIYYTDLQPDSSWSKAVNLGKKINTKANEMFPYIHASNQLFFSSNGHLGLGGLDIFVVDLNDSSSALNLGYPINSRWDDSGLILNDEQNGGIFASNREGGKGFDDIYGFKLQKPILTHCELIGKTVNQQDSIVNQATVYLKNEEGEIIDSTFSNRKGEFTFKVKPEHTYLFTASKEDYLDGDTSKTINYALKDSVLIVLKKDDLKVGTDVAKVLNINPIYFDLNKSNIRANAAKELDKIVKLMNEYPKMEIELGSHTDCRASKSYNLRLSNARAKSSAKYIRAKITNPERIYGKGYGESKLVNKCACEGDVVVECTEEQHQENRRTEFIIIKK